MHQYIKYVLIIFGSTSIMLGCDNNNNNAVSEKLWITCNECKEDDELYSIALHGQNAKGIFTNLKSFLPHFNRYHRKDHLQAIAEQKEIPWAIRDIQKFIEDNYTKKITSSTLINHLKQRHTGENLRIALEKLGLVDDSDDSSISSPIGSPTTVHHMHKPLYYSESDADLKINDNTVPSIARTKRRSVPHPKPSSSKPKLDAPQFFPEDDVKKETKKLKIDIEKSAAFTLVAINNNENSMVFDALTSLTK